MLRTTNTDRRRHVCRLCDDTAKMNRVLANGNTARNYGATTPRVQKTVLTYPIREPTLYAGLALPAVIPNFTGIPMENSNL